VSSNTVAVAGQDDPGEEGDHWLQPELPSYFAETWNESSALISSAARLSPCAGPLPRRRKRVSRNKRQRPGQDAAATAGASKYSWKHPPAWTASGGCVAKRDGDRAVKDGQHTLLNREAGGGPVQR
jgi:hypothetical protein